MRIPFHALLTTLTLCAPCVTSAAPSALTVFSADIPASDSPQTLNFPVTRTGEAAYDIAFGYHTEDGTALAGVDYTPVTGWTTLVAGEPGVFLGVPIPAGGEGLDRSFDFVIDTPVGLGPLPSLAAPQVFAASPAAYPYAVISVDVNGDGRPDLVYVNTTFGTVSVRLDTTTPGASTASFAAEQVFPVGAHPAALTAADIDGDGRLDVIVANRDDDTLSVLLNRTAPGASVPAFAAQSTFGAGAFPLAVTVADINGDGRADVAVADHEASAVSILLNTTATGAAVATFAAAQAITTDIHPTLIAAADLNGDGRADLVAVNDEGSGTASVLINATAPGASASAFAPLQTFDAGAFPEGIVCADIDGDGRADLAVTNNMFFGGVSVLKNATVPGATTASFAARAYIDAGAWPDSIAAADVNRDGRIDLVVSNQTLNAVSVLRNATAPGGVPRFGAPQPFDAGGAHAVTMADVNGDGLPDVVVADSGSDMISILLDTAPPSAATLSIAAPASFPAGANPRAIATADLDGDGRRDLVVADYDESNVSVFMNTAAPGAAASFSTRTTFDAGDFPASLTFADLNGDGKPDLLLANISADTFSVLLDATEPGSGTPAFAARQQIPMGTAVLSITAADINGDGRPDVVATTARDADFNAWLIVALNNTPPGASTAVFGAPQAFTVSSEQGVVTAADINGDGRPDVMVARQTGWQVSVFVNTTTAGSSTVAFSPPVMFDTEPLPHTIVVADIDKDGRPDLAVAGFGGVSIMHNETAPGALTPVFAERQRFSGGLSPVDLVATDIDGDGRADLVMAEQLDRDLTILINTTPPGDAEASFADPQRFFAGVGPTGLVATDLNGDGRIDFVITNGDNTVAALTDTTYHVVIDNGTATGTIRYDTIFANGFE
jgi:hypothetical protein